ncbi:unnamed protein product [Caenorhabditis sp. 36 PRJEB53466]|nr:unnamed protein product [Caenorhabditis sp. 36 PRJEB53466]
MSKLEPTWQNLPFHFKQSVAGRLNFRDRCCLRKCSWNDLHSVDSSTNILDSISIYVSENCSIFSWSDDGLTVITVKYSKKEADRIEVEFTNSPMLYQPGKNQKVIEKITKSFENTGGSMHYEYAFHDFALAIRKLKVNKFIVNGLILNTYSNFPSVDHFQLIFNEHFLKTLQSQTHKIRAQTLHLKWRSEQHEILSVLEHFEPGKLEKIEFSQRRATWQMDRIVRSEQWERANGVRLEVLTELPIEQFLHFSDIQAHVTELSAQDIWTVIRNFIAKNQHGASFHFTHQNSESDLPAILATFDVAPVNEPIHARSQVRQALAGRFDHTQRFAMPSKDLVLVVMISDRDILGTVCHVDRVNEEAKVEADS